MEVVLSVLQVFHLIQVCTTYMEGNQLSNIVKYILYISIDRLYTIFISDCITHDDCKEIGESCFMDICATMGKSYICRYEEMLI